MSTFIEFQNMILDKLCSIENRISNIESVLGIAVDDIPLSDCEQDTAVDTAEVTCCNNPLEDEISDFQKQLNEIKSLFD